MYKELLQQIADRIEGLRVDTDKVDPGISCVVLFYDGDILLDHRFKEEGNNEERAYELIYYDLIEQGIRRLDMIQGMLSEGG